MTHPLITRLIEGNGMDRDLDNSVYCLWRDVLGTFGPVPDYTSSLDACARLAEQVLPGWWWSCGLCGLSGDGSVVLNRASIGPDGSKPILTEQQLDDFDSGFHHDLQPGDGISRVCRALLCCIIEAKEAMNDKV